MIFLVIKPISSTIIKETITLKAVDIDEMCYFFYNFYKLYGGGYYFDCFDEGRDCIEEFDIKYYKYYRMRDMKYSLLKDF